MFDQDARRSLESTLTQGETIQYEVEGVDAVLAVTDRRVSIVDGRRVPLDVPYSQLRRVQFDIERRRQATLVVVPDPPSLPPAVVGIPPEAYEVAAEALAYVGRRLVAT
jgi:hypothetical protein